MPAARLHRRLRAREPAHDPLAELARLIGQNDPFADFNRDGRPAAAEPHYDTAQSGHGDWAATAMPSRTDMAQRRTRIRALHRNTRTSNLPNAHLSGDGAAFRRAL